MDNQALRQKRVGCGNCHLSTMSGTKDDQQACLRCRPNDAIVEEGFVYEAQQQILAAGPGVSQQLHLVGERPMLLRNNPVLIFLTYLGSIAALLISLSMLFVALTTVFPLRAMTPDRFAAAALLVLGAWLMAMTQVFLWRQGNLMAYCSVLLDSFGAHFKLGNAADAKEVFMPWNGIEAVHYKRIQNGQKFTILGADTSTVTFTSYAFYRPKRVARIIAERAGLPLVRG
jgi:hypothetical protein